MKSIVETTLHSGDYFQSIYKGVNRDRDGAAAIAQSKSLGTKIVTGNPRSGQEERGQGRYKGEVGVCKAPPNE